MDYLLMALISLSLLAICLVLSKQRLLWADEEYTRQLVRDPSFFHMLFAWNQGADGGGVLYYIACRWWIELFGFSALTLRLFSTSGVILSFLITWFAARRYFSLFPVACGTSLIFLTSPCILWQDVNGRFYGMFLVAAAMACAAFLRTAEKEDTDANDLLLIAVSQALLIGTHILGVVYSAGFLLATIGFDRLSHRWRPKLYLAGLAGWVLVPLSYRATVNLTSIVKNVFWTIRPTFFDLVKAQFAFDHIVAVCGFLLFAIILIAWTVAWLSKRRQPLHTPLSDILPGTIADTLRANPWIIMLVGLALAQLVLFARSRVTISVYADRYLLPLQIGTVFLLAALITYVGRLLTFLWPLRRWAALAATAVILLCFKYALATPAYAEVYPPAGITQRLERALPPNHEVLTTSLGVFTLMRSYDPSRHYMYAIDWPYDLAPSRAGGDYTAERFMDNWRQAGYARGELLDCTAALNRAPNFTVLLDPGKRQWMQARILDNPAFHATQVGAFPGFGPLTIWTVHRMSAAPAPCR
jgi:hypothetical protein